MGAGVVGEVLVQSGTVGMALSSANAVPADSGLNAAIPTMTL